MRTAIVTGASRGIGLALSEAAAARFDAVVTVGRGPAANAAAAHLVADFAAGTAGLGERLLAMPAVARATDLVFFDNAAILGHGAIGNEDFPARLEEALAVNLSAPLAMARSLAFHAMAANLPITMVHVTSGAACRPIERWGPYCISKAAAVMAYRMIETEFPAVRVVLVDPGAVDTGIQGDLRARGDPAAGARERLVSPVDAARRILEGGSL